MCAVGECRRSAMSCRLAVASQLGAATQMECPPRPSWAHALSLEAAFDPSDITDTFRSAAQLEFS